MTCRTARPAILAALASLLQMPLIGQGQEVPQGVGFSFSSRPPEGAPFTAEFVQTTTVPQSGESHQQRIRVFQDRHGRQRIEHLEVSTPEVWIGTVADWPAGRAFGVSSGAPILDPVPIDLPPAKVGVWQMGFPAEGDWAGPTESVEELHALACRKISWARSDGATVTVWVSSELGYPIQQSFELPELRKVIRLNRLDRREPSPEWFRLVGP